MAFNTDYVSSSLNTPAEKTITLSALIFQKRSRHAYLLSQLKDFFIVDMANVVSVELLAAYALFPYRRVEPSNNYSLREYIQGGDQGHIARGNTSI